MRVERRRYDLITWKRARLRRGGIRDRHRDAVLTRRRARTRFDPFGCVRGNSIMRYARMVSRCLTARP